VSENLKDKTISALFWSFFERIGQQGIQFVISVILARLLLPEEFGLIAMLTIFMAIAQSFIESGFGRALVQKQDTTHVDECSIFYFNILVGICAAGVLCLSAPFIAEFYNQPILVPLTYVLSLNLIINAFGLVQITLLAKQIDFKTQLKVTLIATFVSGAIGVAMAYHGYGVWSLVAQSVCSNLVRTLMLWVFTKWRPSLVFSFVSLREMFAFGSRLLASGLLDTFFNNIYLVVIGRLFSPGSLGFYARAQSLQQLPVSNISIIVSRVSFPVFSSVQNDKPRLKRGVRQALSMLVLINFPMMIGLAVVAKPLVLVLLTAKWLPCVPYLQLLCMVGILYPLHVINLNALTAQGRSDLFFRLEIMKKTLVVGAIAVTCQFGISAMIYGQILSSFLAYFLNAYYTGKILEYPAIEQIYDLLPSLCLSGVMGICVLGVGQFGISSPAYLLMCQILIGLIVYGCLCFLLKVSSFMEIVEMAKSKTSRLGTH
jgi:O-antigen/teichoic acid export membrane protein